MRRNFPLLIAILALACARTSLQSELTSFSYWNGWYEKGHKVGYLQTIVQRYPDHYHFERRGKLTTEMMGEVAVITPNTIVNTTKDYALRDFDFSMATTGHDFHVVGAVKGNKVAMTVETGGQRQSLTLNVPGPVYPLEALPYLIRSKNLQPQAKYEITVFDPMVQKTDESEVTVIGSEKLNLRDTLRDALKVSAMLYGVPHMDWIDSSGTVLREEAPPSSVLLLEPSTTALAARAEETPPDLMNMFAVPVTPKLDNPRQLTALKIELSGIDSRDFDLADESQQVLNASPLTLAIAPPRAPATGVQFPVKGETAATKASLTIQSEDQLIVRKAKELVGSSGDAEAAARTIEQWVFTNIKQKGIASMPSACDVLQTMEGDCNEHAVLYAALCRAVGIPCKICVGLVYRDGYFWYHAWNKVYVGAWIPVDPTFGQFPVDATHLKLTEGEMDQQAKVLTVAGSLAIKVLEAKT